MPRPKYEREIRSLLDKMPTFLGDSPTGQKQRARRPLRGPVLAIQDWWARDAYMMAALLTVLARWGGGALGPGARLLAWIAAALVIVAVLISILRAFLRPRPVQMWRGNVVSFPSRRPYERLLRWWRRFSGGHGMRPY